MGSGSWSGAEYTRRVSAKVDSHGTSFAYTKDTRSKAHHEWTVHEDLDPKRENKKGDHAGTPVRESLDSDEHPETLPIAVIFDVTGSMGSLPRELQEKLPTLHGLLMRKGYVDHPQILFGGVGDAYSDRVPLQIGQFESDNRMGEQLENIFLEGGGGGGNHESYELAAFFLSRYTFLDSLEKRGKKGYCFFVGDERAYANVDRRHVNALVGSNIQEGMTTEEVFEDLQESFHTFFLFAQQGSYAPERVVNEDIDGTAIGWRLLLGQHALILEDVKAVCETIALTIGVMEGRVTLDDGLRDLEEVSTDLESVIAAGKAVATVGAGAGGGAAVVETEGGSFDVGDASEPGVERV